MARSPFASRDAETKLEVLEQFAEAQSGQSVGASRMQEFDETMISDTRHKVVSARRGSAVLGAALRAAGIFPPGPGYHAHHIVPRGMVGAARARDILETCHIGIDSALNGVWLAGNSSAINADGSLIHQGIHSREYLALITRMLAGAARDGEGAVESVMVRLRQRIHDAGYITDRPG